MEKVGEIFLKETWGWGWEVGLGGGWAFSSCLLRPFRYSDGFMSHSGMQIYIYIYSAHTYVLLISYVYVFQCLVFCRWTFVLCVGI